MRVLARCITIGGFWALTCQNILLHNHYLALAYMVMSGIFLMLLSEDVRKQCKWLAVLMLSISGASAADFTNGTPRLLEVPYGTNDITPQTIVLVYTNSNLTVPPANWQLMSVITNLSVTGTSTIPVNLSLPRMFFVARASNEWGIGDFSAVLLSAPPREDVKLRVR